jgi:hypothetical protein
MRDNPGISDGELDERIVRAANDRSRVGSVGDNRIYVNTMMILLDEFKGIVRAEMRSGTAWIR